MADDVHLCGGRLITLTCVRGWGRGRGSKKMFRRKLMEWEMKMLLVCNCFVAKWQEGAVHNFHRHPGQLGQGARMHVRGLTLPAGSEQWVSFLFVSELQQLPWCPFNHTWPLPRLSRSAVCLQLYTGRCFCGVSWSYMGDSNVCEPMEVSSTSLPLML